VWNVWTVAHAQENVPDATNAPEQVFPFPSIVMLVAFIAVMYFIIYRPAQKREKQRRDMLGSLSKGDQVITTGGIYGTIVGLDDKSVVLRVSEDESVKMKFARAAIHQVLPKK
jgi:preprotein translocase subunit YajC